MRLHPTQEQLRTVVGLQGRIISLVGGLAVLVAPVALLAREWNAFSALAATAAIGVLVGELTWRRFTPDRDLTWGEGMVVIGGAYPLMAVVAALPFLLSGHVAGFGDALFEAMSGLTTTGLSVVHDLDHLPRAIATWRQMLQLVGGVTILLAGILVFTPRTPKASDLYLGSASGQERSIPGAVATFASMRRVGLAWGVAGGLALAIALVVAGMPLTRIPFHAMALFTSAFNTGGFAVSSASVAAYHSWTVELVVMVLMVAGAIAFPLHVLLWRGQVRGFLAHIDTRSMVVIVVASLLTVLAGLGRSGAFTDVVPLLRQGMFHVVSAQTTTGLAITESRLLSSDWGLMAPAGLVLAMAVGGMRGSVAGGLKAHRFGLLVKGIVREIRRVLLPDHALVVETFHHEGRRRVLTDTHVRAVGTVLLLYLTTFLAGALVILYEADTSDLSEAMFESVSATSTAGLSVGVVGPASSALLKGTVIVQMWLGRLEFMAVFAFIGFILSMRHVARARRRP